MKPRVREVASLDVMRFLAAQAVMFYHLVFLSWVEPPKSRGIGAIVQSPVTFPNAASWANLGWVGVQIFFVISGFVILMSAQRKSTSEFLIGRVTRIFPALWFFSFLSALVVLVCGLLPFGQVVIRLARSLFLFPMGPWLDGAVWTLVAEAVFYAGIAILIKTNLIGRITIIASAITVFNLVLWSVVLAGEIGAAGYVGSILADLASSYKFRVTLVSTNCYFLVGISLYQIFKKKDVTVSCILFFLNFVICLVSTYYAAKSSFGVSEFGMSPFNAVVVWGVAILVMSGCVLLRVGSSQMFGKFATLAGLLTYPLYLINQITGGFILRIMYKIHLDPVLAVALSAIICTVLAGAFALLIERRMQSHLSTFLKRYSRPLSVLKEA